MEPSLQTDVTKPGTTGKPFFGELIEFPSDRQEHADGETMVLLAKSRVGVELHAPEALYKFFLVFTIRKTDVPADPPEVLVNAAVVVGQGTTAELELSLDLLGVRVGVGTYMVLVELFRGPFGSYAETETLAQRESTLQVIGS